MNETDKLRVLIPHWIEHNHEHAEEFSQWAEKAANASGDLLAAVEAIKAANQALAAGLEKLGGGLPHQHQHHHHHHDDD
ncbi:MAG: hypothetical protein JW757_00955 [Anaerolineales bacterium]|nr:hypothetical protein [Anaerolineales bacterium]